MEKHLEAATMMANFLDNKYSFFGKRFGVSAFIDLIPGIGDVVDAILALYLVWIGLKMRLPADKIWKMLSNIFFNFAIGSIPVIGDVVYIFNRANIKNLQILRQHAKSRQVSEGEIVE